MDKPHRASAPRSSIVIIVVVARPPRLLPLFLCPTKEGVRSTQGVAYIHLHFLKTWTCGKFLSSSNWIYTLESINQARDRPVAPFIINHHHVWYANVIRTRGRRRRRRREGRERSEPFCAAEPRRDFARGGGGGKGGLHLHKSGRGGGRDDGRSVGKLSRPRVQRG